MADRTENYTLFCPCKGIVIEGDLVKVHGERRESLPGPGTFVVCPCGCLHRVHEVDERARLVVVVALSHDEQLDVYADMGLDMVKVGCPHCDAVHTAEVPDGLNPVGLILECFDCHKALTVVERDGRELLTRALTDDEVAAMAARVVAESRARAFGGWASGAGAATGSTPFGADPFHPFGGSS
jgi:hypothetical protein